VATNNSPEHRPIDAPSGLDLHPQPEKAVRISRRATIGIITLIVLLLVGFAYGGYHRNLTNQIAARDANLPRSVTPATQAGAEFMQGTPAGTVSMNRNHADELRPPGTSALQAMTVPCGTDPRTRQAYRYNPQTGQPCDGLPQERVVIRQPNAIRSQPITPTPVHEETAEDRRLAEAYQREQEAIQAPTSIRNAATPSLSAISGQPTPNDLSQVAALSHALGARQGGDSVPLPNNGAALENDYDSQNMQSRKEAFLTGARTRQSDDYLRSTREAPLSDTKSKQVGRFRRFSNRPSTQTSPAS